MKSMKRILAIVMVMAMMFSLVAINASAANSVINSTIIINNNALYIGGTLVSNPLDPGPVTYDSNTNTLTLDSVTITPSSGSGVVFNNTGKLNIVIKGDCEINATEAGIYTYAGDKLTIKGEDGASLKINSSNNCGIWVDGSAGVQDCVIENLELTVDSSKLNCICVGNGDLTIKNSTVICKVANTATADAISVANDIKIENSKMDITAKKGSGIYAPDGNIEIDESTLDIEAGCYGIASKNNTCNLTINDSKLSIDAGYECISVNATVTIKNTEATLTSTEASKNAIYGKGNICFYGNDVIDATAQGATVNSGGSVIFQLNAGSKVHAKSTGSMNAAFLGATGITINNGKITVPENGTAAGTDTYIKDANGNMVSEATVSRPEYTIAQTADELVWEKGCCDVLTVTSDADIFLFTKILVDDVEVPRVNTEEDYDNYKVMQGSTKVLLTAGYLETLSVGKHTIEIVSNDGSVKGTFTIVEAEKTTTETTETTEEVAQTADNTAIGAFVALGAFAAAGYVSLKKKEN